MLIHLVHDWYMCIYTNIDHLHIQLIQIKSYIIITII